MTPPNAQGWMAIGLFALTAGILIAVATIPGLEKNQLFSNLAVAIVSGAFCGGAVALYFNTTAGSAKKDETIRQLSSKVDGQ